MSVTKVKNTAASVREKLASAARRSGRLFDALLLQYLQERFLYRLSISKYSENLILKGAMLFLSYGISEARPTKDIDFLARSTKNSIDNIEIIFAEIVNIRCDDGVVFTPDGMRFEKINRDGKYSGLRVTFEASLARAVKTLQIDVGFGDVVTDGPVLIDFPVILPQNPVPKIYSYSLASAIAEKFEAIVKLSYANSRMKDFYDIIFLAGRNTFDMRTIKEAIANTFKNRKTSLSDINKIFQDNFIQAPENNKKWKTFKNKNNIEINDDFPAVMNKIMKFIKPLLEADGYSEKKAWNHTNYSWAALDN